MELSIAFLQLLPEGSLQENLNKGVAACREAKERGADIALFPEMWSTGYRFPHDMKALHELAISEESMFIKRFSETAAKLDMAIAITFFMSSCSCHLLPRNSLLSIAMAVPFPFNSLPIW